MSGVSADSPFRPPAMVVRELSCYQVFGALATRTGDVITLTTSRLIIHCCIVVLPVRWLRSYSYRRHLVFHRYISSVVGYPRSCRITPTIEATKNGGEEAFRSEIGVEDLRMGCTYVAWTRVYIAKLVVGLILLLADIIVFAVLIAFH